MRRLLFSIAVVSVTLYSLYAHGQSPEENKKIIRRYLLEIFHGQKWARLSEVLSEKFVRHNLNDSTETWMTIADQQKRLSDLFRAFPDFHYTISDMVAEGDKVVVRTVWHGIQKKIGS